jgi:putative ABC transport system substrate-binding protein
MRRRTFLGLPMLAVTARPIITLAQASAQRPLIAVVIGTSQTASQPWRRELAQGLQELRYVEGRDYEIEYRYADGDPTRQPVLVDELIRHKPIVIVAENAVAALAAAQATISTPIVVGVAADPVGLVTTTRASPRENVTGLFAEPNSLGRKQLELAFELIPGAKRVGMLVNVLNAPNVALNMVLRDGVETAAKAIRVNLISFEIRSPADIQSAFQTLARGRVNLVMVTPDPMFLEERQHMAVLALEGQLPVMYGFREHVEGGGLMSYGVDRREAFRRVAAYVGKILKGAKPADLPFEPTKFELVINLKTAKALGLTVPATLLARADEVIE